MKKNGIYAFSGLFALLLLFSAYHVFTVHFERNGEKLIALHQVEAMAKQEREKRLLAELRLVDLLQSSGETIHRREIASISSSQIKLDKIDLSSSLMAKAKTDFSQKKYKNTILALEELIQKFPVSESVAEAYFFIGESAFLSRQFDKAVEIAELMSKQFPEDNLTGFMLIRLGQINEMNSRFEEAREIYSVVKNNFPHPDLKKQSLVLLQAIESL